MRNDKNKKNKLEDHEMENVSGGQTKYTSGIKVSNVHMTTKGGGTIDIGGNSEESSEIKDEIKEIMGKSNFGFSSQESEE